MFCCVYEGGGLTHHVHVALLLGAKQMKNQDWSTVNPLFARSVQFLFCKLCLILVLIHSCLISRGFRALVIEREGLFSIFFCVRKFVFLDR
jgi:hypothetical protein